MSDKVEELGLFRKMQQGDVSALEYFFQEYMEVLYYKALGYIQEPQAAEDIVQDAFISFWDNRKRTEISISVPAYLNRLVINACKNHLLHRQVVLRYERDLAARKEDREEWDYNREDLEETRRQLDSFISRLPEKCREIFILACIEGKKYQAVADTLGVSVNTVKTQVKSAYSKLRAEFSLPKERELVLTLLLIQVL